MKIVCFLLKLVLKILLLPVAFLLRFLCFIWNLLMQLSLWVLSPVMLFRSWLRHLFGGSGELDGCVPADPD